MFSARSAVRLAYTLGMRQSCKQLQARRHQYSTAKETKSSSIPWILSAVVITTGGIWFTVGSSKPVNSHSLHPEDTNAKEHKPPSPEKEEKRRDYMTSIAKDAPKAEHGGSSVLNHGKAAEANEHKTRIGKFSGKSFDNHVTKHSGDPAKDFEVIPKEEAESTRK